MHPHVSIHIYIYVYIYTFLDGERSGETIHLITHICFFPAGSNDGGLRLQSNKAAIEVLCFHRPSGV